MRPGVREHGMYIEFHADDYGQTLAQSEDILSCYTHGILTAVSIMPCSPCLPEAMAMLTAAEQPDRPISRTIHLDLIEGKALTSEKVPHLVNEKGELSCRFGEMLLWSCWPGKRKIILEELKTELRAQIQRCLPYVNPEALRLDSHAHYHMVPVVFDALMELIDEDRLKVAFIRFPRENLGLYWRHRKEISRIRPINLVKTVLLNALVRRNMRVYRTETGQLERFAFMGVTLSGHMFARNILALLKDAAALARVREENLQMLFHPGGVYDEEELKNVNSQADRLFFSSGNRRKEKESLIELRDKTAWLKNVEENV